MNRRYKSGIGSPALRRGSVGAGLALCALVTAFAPVPAHAQQPLKIGVILPYSGQFADGATQLDNGIKLYVQQHGDTVANRRIEIIRRDTGGIAPEIAKRLARELVARDNVDILAGFHNTPNAMSVAAVSAEAKKFMVVMLASTAIITMKSPYIVRTSLTTAQTTEVLGAWAFKNGIKQAYTMVSDYGPGYDAEAAFRRSFKEAGGEIVGSMRFPVNIPDFAPYLQRIKDANPEAIYVFLPAGSQPAAFATALRELGIDARKTKILGEGTITEENALANMGDAGLGIITSFHYDYNHDSKANKDFVKAFNDSFGRNPDFFSVGGYDGMHLICEAVKKTGGRADVDSLLAAAGGMAWESPRGPISIDPVTRDIIQTIYIRRVEKVGGHLRNVELENIPNVKDPVKARMKD